MGNSATRVANAVMALFFSYATYVQKNDPDATAWMMLYSAAAYTCFLMTTSSTPTRFFNLLAVGLFMYAGIQIKQLLNPIPETLDQWKKVYDVDTEFGRELGGLTVVALWMAIMLISEDFQFRGRQTKGSQGGSGLLSWGLVGVALAVLASTYVMPKYVMSGPAAEEHCRGVGFAAGKTE